MTALLINILASFNFIFAGADNVTFQVETQPDLTDVCRSAGCR